MNDIYQVGATIYGEDGMMVVSDNSLRYMTASSGGWQDFEPTDKSQRLRQRLR